MKVSKGLFSIQCEGINGVVPTVRELSEIDQRIIYLGSVKTSDGKTLNDAFIFTLRPEEALTIKDIKVEGDKAFLDYEQHTLASNNPAVLKVLSEHREETYIGTVCIDTAQDGRVYEDVYETFLGSGRFYQKKEDGTNNYIGLQRELLSYPDRYRWKITEKVSGKDFHYAFLWGINGYNKWLALSHTNPVLHNFSPSICDIDDYEVRTGMQKYPEAIRKLFEDSYSTEGYLAVS